MKIHTFFKIKKSNILNSKKTIVSITTFALILVLAISLFIGTIFLTDTLKEKVLIKNKNQEVLNSVQTFRSQLLDVISKNNSNLTYNNKYDLESIKINLENKTISGIDKSLKFEIIEINISTLGMKFCTNYSFYPVGNTSFNYNGSCISKN